MSGVNLVRYSSHLAQPIWASANIAVADLGGTTTSPTGRGCRLIATTPIAGSTDFLYENQIPEYQPNSQYTLSMWLSQETWSEPLTLLLGDSAGNGVDITVTPDTWSLGAAADYTATVPWASPTGGMDALPDGWKRLWVAGITGPTTGLTLGVFLKSSSVPVGNSLLVGGFALYQGTATTFVDTTTAPQGSQFLPMFPFPYFTETTRYPQNSTSVQFGNSYVFVSKPIGPPQRTFLLEFPGLAHYVNNDGTPNLAVNLATNAGALDAFYQQVQLYGSFFFNHPRYGQLVCKFAKPIELLRPEPGGGGVIKNLQIELIEIPV